MKMWLKKQEVEKMNKYKLYFCTQTTLDGRALVQGTLTYNDGDNDIGISELTKSDAVSIAKTKQKLHDTLVKAYHIYTEND